MLFGITLYPLGLDVESIARPVADFIDEIEDAVLPYQVTALETLVEGEWDQVMPVVQRAYERLLRKHGRAFLDIRVDEHVGVRGRLREAVDDVDRELGYTVAR